MTLPDNTNELIAKGEGWAGVHLQLGGLVGRPKIGKPDYEVVPNYTTSLDAIEPIFNKRLPGAIIEYKPFRYSNGSPCYRALRVKVPQLSVPAEIYADTLTEAMCAAVLAAMEATPPTPEREES